MTTDSLLRQSTSNGRQVRAVVHFDARLMEFWVKGNLVKRLDIRATNQIRILTAFQEENWPPSIYDPLHPNAGDAKARLRSTIHCLNAHQNSPGVHFFADGTGRGIRWELSPANTNGQTKRKQSGKTRSATYR